MYQCFSALLSLASLFAVVAPAQAQAPDLSTPAKAWATLEAAYQRKDVETMIAGHDYETEARLIGNSFLTERDKADYAKKGIDPIAAMAKEMVSKVRREGRDNTGFPLRGNPVCRITDERQLEADVVELQQQCVTEKGIKLAPKLRFKQTGKQWRLFDVIWDQAG